MRALARSRAAGEGSGGQPIPRRFSMAGHPHDESTLAEVVSRHRRGRSVLADAITVRDPVRRGIPAHDDPPEERAPRRSAKSAVLAACVLVGAATAMSAPVPDDTRRPPSPLTASPSGHPPPVTTRSTTAEPSPVTATPSAPGIPPSSAPTSRPGDDPPEPSLPTTAVTPPANPPPRPDSSTPPSTTTTPPPSTAPPERASTTTVPTSTKRPGPGAVTTTDRSAPLTSDAARPP